MIVPEDLKDKHKRIAKRWKIALALLIGVIAAPVVVAGIEGLLGLIAIWLISTAAIQFAPVASMKIANWKLKMIKAEAEANPVETMEDVYKEKSEAIQSGDEKIVAFEGRYRTYVDQLEDFKANHPKRADRFVKIGTMMGEALRRMKVKQRKAKVEQQAYWEKIKEARAIYSMAFAARAVSELSADAEQQVFRQIREEVAFDQITNTFNSAVAELTVDIQDPEEFSPDVISGNKELPQLSPVQDSELMDIPTTKEEVKVRK